MKRIVLDPGHGGNDSGACAHGIQEKDLNLAVALATRDILRDCGHTVLMTHDSDCAMSLHERGCFAVNKQADVFLSIHHDAADNNPKVHGCHGFYDNEDCANARDMMTNVARAIAVANGTGHSYGAPASTWFDKHLGVLAACENWRHVTAGLIECLFLTNAAEAEKAKAPGYVATTARAIAAGIQWHLALPVLNASAVSGDDGDGQAHDVDEISSWAKGAAEFVRAKGISDCTRPKQPATREEVWCYLQRLYAVLKPGG